MFQPELTEASKYSMEATDTSGTWASSLNRAWADVKSNGMRASPESVETLLNAQGMSTSDKDLLNYLLGEEPSHYTSHDGDAKHVLESAPIEWHEQEETHRNSAEGHKWGKEEENVPEPTEAVKEDVRKNGLKGADHSLNTLLALSDQKNTRAAYLLKKAIAQHKSRFGDDDSELSDAGRAVLDRWDPDRDGLKPPKGKSTP